VTFDLLGRNSGLPRLDVAKENCNDFGSQVSVEGWVNVTELATTLKQARPYFM